MPPRSQAQRAAMHAAAEGHSTLGIPKDVGEEFDEADHGGKLPEKKKKEAGLVKRIMRAFKLDEISAVDRPAQAHAKVVLMKRDDNLPLVDWSNLTSEDIVYLCKRDFSADQRRSAASSGDALPDGSFPIKNKEDLANARRLVGHAKNPAAARALIRRRAKELGVSMDDDAKKQLAKLIDDHLAGASAEEIEKALEEFDPTETAMDEDIKKAVDAAVKPIAEELAKAQADLAIAKEDLIKASMSIDEWNFYQTLGKASDDDESDKKTFREMSAEDRKKKMKKAADDMIPEYVRKQLDEAETMKKRLAALEDDKAVASFAKRADEIGFNGHGETLRKAYTGNAEAITKLESILKGLTEQIRTGKVFEEFGSNQGGPGPTAHDEILAQAKLYRDGQINVGKKCSPEQAFTAVYTDPAHADLKKRYDHEEIQKRRAA